MIVNKPYTNEQYANLAVFCNENDCHIEDKGEYLESVANEHPQSEKEEAVRAIRNSYLEQYIDPYQLVIRWESLSETEQEYLREYRQYLLDYTKEENWWEKNPDDYATWLLAHHPVVQEESV